jgi:ABC-type antimicrobial peptide transport system permease subunit
MILQKMQTANIQILLLGLVFNIILLVFMVISVLLIYSLLMIGVETKTMETGIMRMVGVSKRGLVTMIGI